MHPQCTVGHAAVRTDTVVIIINVINHIIINDTIIIIEFAQSRLHTNKAKHPLCELSDKLCPYCT